MTHSIIVDRGRGPEIRGTRITVFDIMDYHTSGWTPGQIAAVFQLPLKELEEAIAFIESHRVEVERAYSQILSRHRRHTAADEVDAKIRSNRERFKALVSKTRGQQNTANTRHRVGL